LNRLEARERSRPAGSPSGPQTDSGPEETLLALLAPEALGEEAWKRALHGLKRLKARLAPDLHREILDLLFVLGPAAPEHTRALIRFLPDLLGILPEEAARFGLEQARRIARFSGLAAYGFLSHLVQIHKALGSAGMVPWTHQGIRLLEKNLRSGEAFFALTSLSGRRSLAQGAHTVTLAEVRDCMRLYAHALSGKPLGICSTADGLSSDAGLYPSIYPSSDGMAIYLPPQVEVYPTYEENSLYYKILCSHQAGYLESGTFGFSLFRYLRRLTEHPFLRRWKPSVSTDALSGDFFSHIQIFCRLFPDPFLAQTLFTLLEDGRVDTHLRHRYAGLKKDMAFFVEDVLARRPSLEGMPIRDAFLEILLRLSLDPETSLATAPPPLSQLAGHLRRVLRSCFRPTATVEDAAMVSTELYGILQGLLGFGASLPPEALAAFLASHSADRMQEVKSLQGLPPEGSADKAEPGTHEWRSLEDFRPRVELRGDTDLGLTQKGLQIKKDLQEISSDGPNGAWQTIPLEELKRLLEQGIEPALSIAPEAGQEDGLLFFFEAPHSPHSLLPLRKLLENTEGERYRKIWSLKREHRKSFRDPEEKVFHYEEWDSSLEDYRQDWCRLIEREGKSSARDFVREVRALYGPLISSLRRQFEMLRPEQYRMEKALIDGEDIDLDRTVESLVDRSCGITGSDRLYRERRRIERDVSTLFLLDMSSSTDERVRLYPPEHGNPLPPAFNAGGPAPDSMDQIAWVLSGIRSGMGLSQEGSDSRQLSGKRIIDIEKEALVLMAEALEPLGDRYGIYGFSGAGRMQVEFYTIKEFSERYGCRVKDRISGIEPRGSTRMGTALRHCRFKLRKEEARRRNLFLISDGFPQDQEYGEGRSGYDYAVQDTARALAELAEEGTYTYCITVDRHGEDYLRRMCPESQYMVIEDIRSLPEALLKIYRKVTDQAPNARS
jgi:nitric oxide reductase activation protein